jgi:Delta14-sterol reductase
MVCLFLIYVDKGFMSLVCIALYTWSSVRIHGLQSLTFLYDHFLGLTFAAFLWSVVLATGTYISSFRGEPLLAEGGNTGNWIYDVRCWSYGTNWQWFIGRILNPRIPVPFHEHPKRSFDIKTFIEIRVGLINWLLFDIAFLAKQYDRYGFVTDSMWLVVIFQGFYVVDALWFEEAFFSTMDVAYRQIWSMLMMQNGWEWVYVGYGEFTVGRHVLLFAGTIPGVLSRDSWTIGDSRSPWPEGIGLLHLPLCESTKRPIQDGPSFC